MTLSDFSIFRITETFFPLTFFAVKQQSISIIFRISSIPIRFDFESWHSFYVDIVHWWFYIKTDLFCHYRWLLRMYVEQLHVRISMNCGKSKRINRFVNEAKENAWNSKSKGLLCFQRITFQILALSLLCMPYDESFPRTTPLRVCVFV